MYTQQINVPGIKKRSLTVIIFCQASYHKILVLTYSLIHNSDVHVHDFIPFSVATHYSLALPLCCIIQFACSSWKNFIAAKFGEVLHVISC